MAKKVLKMVQKRFASHVKKSRKEDSKGKKENLKNDDPVNENWRFLRAPGREVDENRLQKGFQASEVRKSEHGGTHLCSIDHSGSVTTSFGRGYLLAKRGGFAGKEGWPKERGGMLLLRRGCVGGGVGLELLIL